MKKEYTKNLIELLQLLQNECMEGIQKHDEFGMNINIRIRFAFNKETGYWEVTFPTWDDEYENWVFSCEGTVKFEGSDNDLEKLIDRHFVEKMRESL